jgi:hypothetical protein
LPKQPSFGAPRGVPDPDCNQILEPDCNLERVDEGVKQKRQAPAENLSVMALLGKVACWVLHSDNNFDLF